MSGEGVLVLEACGVCKRYGRQVALQDVDVRVSAGEFVVLLGPNGAGKTTLFRLLTGLFAADEGDIRVGGFDIRREPVRALALMGVVFQEPALDLDLTVGANLRFHARLHGLGRSAGERIDAALSALGLAEQIGARARTLSSGNRRRVELARALLTGPRLLLMDEATVGLDPMSRQSLLMHVRQLCRREGTAVLWATHLLDEAQGADRVVVLDQGRMILDGRPGEMPELDGPRALGELLAALSGSRDRNRV